MSARSGYRSISVRWADVVYGSDGPDLDDAAEVYHEASCAYAASAGRDGRGVRLLETSAELRATVRRSVKRHAERQNIPLPRAKPLARPLGEAMGRRRSVREFSAEPITLTDLATLLDAGYGVTAPNDGRTAPDFRAVPSGGALYPLELHVLALRVGNLGRGLYHFDPLLRGLEHARDSQVVPAVLEAMIYRPPVEEAAVAIVVSAMFWRTRFKYGLRGYRFALLETGHVAQNLLLAATGLGLSAVPLGGFFDRALATALDIDGVNEAPLYVVCVGRQ